MDFQNFRTRLKSWLPDRPEQVYIVPTGFGAVYASGLLLMLLMAYTYQNNLAYLLTFFLTSFAGGSMFSTHRYIQNFSLEPGGALLQEAGRPFHPPFRDGAPEEAPRAVSLKPRGSALAALPGGDWLALKRGWHEVSSVEVSSSFPLGVFRAWKKSSLKLLIIVTPRSFDHGLPMSPLSTGAELEKSHSRDAADDLQGLSDARPETPPGQIDWRSYARGRGLVKKDFEAPKLSRLSIDYRQTAALADVEPRLEQMTFWIRQAVAARRPVEIRLPDDSLTRSPDEALRFLARWEVS